MEAVSFTIGSISGIYEGGEVRKIREGLKLRQVRGSACRADIYGLRPMMEAVVFTRGSISKS